jgi:hypothetical protein
MESFETGILYRHQMKLIFPYCILVFFMACGQKEKRLATLPQHIVVQQPVNKTDYDSCKKQILIIKQQNRSGWNALPALKKQTLFTKAVAETIMPGWIGTTWDFNGTTETPQQGSIACGYFVTTVLRDAGVPLARVKLAQCASEQMIQALVQAKYIRHYSNVDIKFFTDAVVKDGYGLYIVGLDNHTGFIYNDGTDIYFIHSTFVGTRNVQKEIAGNSWVLKQSKYKVLGKISADEKLLQRWIN